MANFIEEKKREIIMCSFIGIFIMSFLVKAETKMPLMEQHNYWVGGLAIIGAAVFFMNYWEKKSARQYPNPPVGRINDGPRIADIPPPNLSLIERPQKVYPIDNADPGTAHVIPITEDERRKNTREKKKQDAKTKESE